MRSRNRGKQRRGDQLTWGKLVAAMHYKPGAGVDAPGSTGVTATAPSDTTGMRSVETSDEAGTGWVAGAAGRLSIATGVALS